MVATVPRRLATPSSVNAAIKQIADVMRRANYAGALQYVLELLDEIEDRGHEVDAAVARLRALLADEA